LCCFEKSSDVLPKFLKIILPLTVHDSVSGNTNQIA